VFVASDKILMFSECPSILASTIFRMGSRCGKYLLSLGVKCDASAFTKLIEEIPSREEFKLFWESRVTDLNYQSVLSNLFALAPRYEHTRGGFGNGEKQRLLLLAWRFGNEDNLFKRLPREILEQIIQYHIDTPYWYSIGELILRTAPAGSINIQPVSLESAVFMVAYRHLLAGDSSITALRQICNRKEFYQNSKVVTTLKLMRRIDPDLKLSHTENEDVPFIIPYCIQQNVALLELLLQQNILDTKHFTSPRWISYNQFVPVSWAACLERRNKATELLCKYGMLPLKFQGRNLKTVWLITHAGKTMYDLVIQCIQRYNTCNDVEIKSDASDDRF